jgi:hypothetical protein
LCLVYRINEESLANVIREHKDKKAEIMSISKKLRKMVKNITKQTENT